MTNDRYFQVNIYADTGEPWDGPVGPLPDDFEERASLWFEPPREDEVMSRCEPMGMEARSIMPRTLIWAGSRTSREHAMAMAMAARERHLEAGRSWRAKYEAAG